MLQLFGDNDSEEQLKSLTKEMIQKSYFNNDSLNSFREIIDDNFYKCLNPNYNKNTEVQLINIDLGCLANKSKAIVYWSNECYYNPQNDVTNCELNTHNLPYDRLYFEKIDGEWKVVDFVQLA